MATTGGRIMKTWFNNFVAHTKTGLGECKYFVSYIEDKTEDGIPKQLQILKGNKFYIYNLVAKI